MLLKENTSFLFVIDAWKCFLNAGAATNGLLVIFINTKKQIYIWHIKCCYLYAFHVHYRVKFEVQCVRRDKHLAVYMINKMLCSRIFYKINLIHFSVNIHKCTSMYFIIPEMIRIFVHKSRFCLISFILQLY